MIYSAQHRPSLVERFVNLIGPTIAVAVTWWLVFSGILGMGRDTNLFLTAVVFILSLAIGVFIHESGHVLTGLALGQPARKVRIGTGPTLITFRVTGVRVQICVNPLGGGIVYFSALDDSPTAVRIASTAAGPVVNLLAALYAAGMINAGAEWLGPFAVANLALALGSLLPSSSIVDGHEQPSDGLQIVRMLAGRMPRSLYSEGGVMTPEAHAVLVHAVEESRDEGAAEITDMHLLRAMARAPDMRPLLASIDTRALAGTSGAPTSEELKPSWSPVADQVEQATFRIARDLGRSKPNPACICLGMMAVDCAAGRLLKAAAVSESALRVLAAGGPDEGEGREVPGVTPDLPLERWGSAADRTLALAYRIADADRSAHVGTEHMLSALMAEPSCRAARALEHVGFVLVRDDRAALKRDVRSTLPMLSPQAAGAIAAALRRTGPTYPTGTGELCLGIADQGGGMGAMLLASSRVQVSDLERALRLFPRDSSDPVGFTATARRMWELRASARLGAGLFLEARADFMTVERAATNDAVRALSRNNAAWATLMSGEPTLRAEALELARSALDSDPERPAFKGTYAFALLENGHPAEAAALLDPVAATHPRPRDRALDLCLLSICRARLGDAEAAAAHLREAEAADPRGQLLERARAELSQAAAVATTARPA